MKNTYSHALKLSMNAWDGVIKFMFYNFAVTFSSNANFGGFLVIGRDMNGANVGTFTAAAGQQRACSVSSLKLICFCTV